MKRAEDVLSQLDESDGHFGMDYLSVHALSNEINMLLSQKRRVPKSQLSYPSRYDLDRGMQLLQDELSSNEKQLRQYENLLKKTADKVASIAGKSEALKAKISQLKRGA
jgi:chromosome segregation ATPase